jgi:DHA2 family multidrug resistance protein-like MFS transporter
MMATALPSGISAEAAQAAQGTLGGAIAVAAELSNEIGAALLAAARGAFVHSLELAAAISAAIVIATAVLAVALLRRMPRHTESTEVTDRTKSSSSPPDKTCTAR